MKFKINYFDENKVEKVVYIEAETKYDSINKFNKIYKDRPVINVEELSERICKNCGNKFYSDKNYNICTACYNKERSAKLEARLNYMNNKISYYTKRIAEINEELESLK